MNLCMHSKFSLLFLFSVVRISSQSEWCYDGAECGDKAQWAGACASGQHQSPLNIDTMELPISDQEELKIKFSKAWCEVQKRFYLRNTGHSVEVRLAADSNCRNHTMSGDGFRGSYYFAQIHFHWGNRNDKGSEHTIDGKAQALEIHFVHVNEKQGPPGSAEASSNLAVLGILAHADEAHPPNPALQPILDVLSQVSGLEADMLNSFKIPIRLFDFLPKNRTIFRYIGSLTTPPCSESVVWSVFAEPMKISISQLEEFRKSRSQTGRSMSNNFRSIIPKNNRKITKHQFISNCDTAQENGSAIGRSLSPELQQSFKNMVGVKEKVPSPPTHQQKHEEPKPQEIQISQNASENNSH